MVARAHIEDIILFLVDQSHDELSITKLMKLVYLADVEHQQLYGEPLSGVRWHFYHYGPFTRSVYEAAESLEEKGQLTCLIQPAFDEKGMSFASADNLESVVGRLSPRARRVLSNVLGRWGHLSVQQIKQVAYETITMREATRGDLLDLSREPRRSLSSKIPGLATFRDRAPTPIVRDIGDAEASAAEDRDILSEFAGLRHAANRELG